MNVARGFALFAVGIAPTLMPAQSSSDREIMRRIVREFERSGYHFDCDSCEGATPCYRYCNDLEFIRLDSTLEVEFEHLLSLAPSDSARATLDRHNSAWLIARREQCRIPTEGWTGSLGPVLYVDCMNELTRLRIQEVTWLRDAMEN